MIVLDSNTNNGIDMCGLKEAMIPCVKVQPVKTIKKNLL